MQWQFETNTHQPTRSHMVSKQAAEDWLEYKQVKQNLKSNENNEALMDPNGGCSLRELQRQHSIIIHTDAALDIKKERAGLGDVAKDERRNLKLSWAISCTLRGNPDLLEACAIRIALLKAMEEHFTSILIVSDCREVIRKLNFDNEDISGVGLIANDIKTLSHSFWRCSFSFVKRDCNTCSHSVARFASGLVNKIRWKGNFPVWLIKAAMDVNPVLHISYEDDHSDK